VLRPHGRLGVATRRWSPVVSASGGGRSTTLGDHTEIAATKRPSPACGKLLGIAAGLFFADKPPSKQSFQGRFDEQRRKVI